MDWHLDSDSGLAAGSTADNAATESNNDKLGVSSDFQSRQNAARRDLAPGSTRAMPQVCAWRPCRAMPNNSHAMQVDLEADQSRSPDPVRHNKCIA